jgi:hypothetical protein
VRQFLALFVDSTHAFHCGWVGASVAAGYVIAQYNLANCLGTGANGIYEKNLTTSACLYLRSSCQGTSPLFDPRSHDPEMALTTCAIDLFVL